MKPDMKSLALACREAAVAVAALGPAAKRDLLLDMARRIEADAAGILNANAVDLRRAEGSGISAAMLDRLRLDPERIAGVARGLREVAALPDPVGQVTHRDTRPNGVLVERVLREAVARANS